MRLLCLLCLLLAPGLVLADDGAKVRAGESPKAPGLRTNLTIDQVSAIFVPGFPDSVPNLTDNSRFLEEKNALAYSGSATEKFDGMMEFAEEPREGRSESAILETALLVKGWKSLCTDWFRLAGEPGTMAVTTGVSEAIANLSFRRVVLSCAGHRDEILFAIGADRFRRSR